MEAGVREEVGYIAPVEGLRGVALLWVVAFHYALLRPAAGIADPWVEALHRLPLADLVVRNGYLGVDLFFLISGFLLAMPWFVHRAAGRPAPSAGAFWLRRARRIVPAYYLQLVFLFALVLPLLHGRKYWRSDVYVDLWNAVAHAVFLQNTTPLTAASLGANGALWTLAVEAQFYLLLPLLAALFVRFPRRALLASIAVALAWQWDGAHGFAGWVGWELRWGARWGWSERTVRDVLAIQLPAFAGHFALGIVLGKAWLAARASRAPVPFVLQASAALLAIALLAACLDGAIGVPPRHARMLPALALGILLWLAATARGPAVRAILGRGVLAFAGRLSYSAYLYHLPLLLLWNAYARGVTGWLALPTYLAALVAISAASRHYVEEPFLEGKFVPGRSMPLPRAGGEDSTPPTASPGLRKGT